MRRLVQYFALLVSIAFLLVEPALAQNAIVHAILFYSPTCPHCHKVMTEDLPPLLEAHNSQLEWTYLPTEEPLEQNELPPLVGAFGDQLQILYINTTTPIGSELFTAAINEFNIPEDRQAVPTLIVAKTVLVGSVEIPEQFPALIEQGFAQGGLAWPDFAGLSDHLPLMISAQPSDTSPEQTPTPIKEARPRPTSSAIPDRSTQQDADRISAFDFDDTEPSVIDKIMNDPIANIVAILVLIGLIVAVVRTLIRVARQPANPSMQPLPIAMALLALAGIFVAGYLTFVEASGAEAVCGPVGDCNTVQQSKYATLFGVIPVGALGLVGFIAILGAWFLSRLNHERLSPLATIAIFAMAIFGTLFSIYLTFLEPFVIGAACAWCLASAILIASQLWLSADPFVDALEHL